MLQLRSLYKKQGLLILKPKSAADCSPYLELHEGWNGWVKVALLIPWSSLSNILVSCFLIFWEELPLKPQQVTLLFKYLVDFL